MSSAAETTNVRSGFDEAAFEAFLKGRDEPSWLVDRRKEAFAISRALPWPTARDEEWRRTDIRTFKPDRFATGAGAVPSADDREALAPAWDALSANYPTGIEQVNGVVTRRPDATGLGKAIYTDLATAVRDHPELVRKYLLADAVRPDADALSALHAAFWTGGAVPVRPQGGEGRGPALQPGRAGGGGERRLRPHPRRPRRGGRGDPRPRDRRARGARGHPGSTAGRSSCSSGTTGRLRFVNVQNWDDSTWHFSRERAIVGRDATIQWTVGGLGARLAKVNQEVALAGRGASAQVNGVMFTTGKQHLAYFTRQDHIAPNTRSDLLYKGGLKDRSRVVWKGMIRVEKDAQKTDAYQKNDNLILSDAARADSIPGLEIEANDVRCTHGATAGRVDEEMIFYAQARGVGRETAIRLIVEGFFANVYDRITLEPVRETLRAAVAEKLQIGGPARPLTAEDA